MGNRTQNKKIKQEQYKEVRELYEELKSLRRVAIIYRVDKGTISKIVNPVQAEKAKINARLQSHVYRERLKTDKERQLKRNESMRKHRKHKHELYLKGELKDD